MDEQTRSSDLVKTTQRSVRRTRVGVVESDSGNKTVKVRIDRVMKHIFAHYAEPDEAENIDRFRQGPLGNDETAFDVGGVNIPCGVVMRGPFDEYHTDADNVDAVDEERFARFTGPLGVVLESWWRMTQARRAR